MPFDWKASAAINFSSNGRRLFRDLEAAASKLVGTLKLLDTQVKSVDLLITSIGKSATTAAAGVTDLNVSLRMSARRAATASRSYRTLAGAADDAAAATNVLAASQARLGAMGFASARVGGGGGGRGSAAPSLIGGVAGAGARVAHIGIEAGAAAAVDAVYEAANFQSALTSIQNITGAHEDQMNVIRQQLMDIGNMAGMSPLHAAGMFREITRQSQGALSLDAMRSLLPEIAKMQVVLGQTRGYSAETTTDSAMAFVHLMRLYKPQEMKSGFDLATRLFELSPVAPQQLIRQLTYFVPQLENLHVPNEQSAAIMLTLARAGYGQGKGGSGLAQLVMQSLGPLQITSFQQALKAGYLGKGGLDLLDAKGKPRFFNDKKGDVLGLLEQLDKYESSHGSIAAQKMFTSVFGVNGGRIAALLADPTIVKQLRGAEKAINDKGSSLGLDKQYDQFSGQAKFQIGRSAQNFQAVMTEVGMLTLPAVTEAAKMMGDAFHDAQHWLNQNKGATNAFMNGLNDDVKLVGAAIAEHKSDFVSLGKDIYEFVSSLHDLARGAILVMAPITRLARVLIDVGSVDVGDLKAIIDEQRNATKLTRLPSPGDPTDLGQRSPAYWQNFARTHGGWDAVPANVRNMLHDSGFPTNGRAPDKAAHAGAPVHIAELHLHVGDGHGLESFFKDPRSWLAAHGVFVSHARIAPALTAGVRSG